MHNHASGCIFACPGTLYGDIHSFGTDANCADRHNGGCNFTFCDEHAKYYRIQQRSMEVKAYNNPIPNTTDMLFYM